MFPASLPEALNPSVTLLTSAKLAFGRRLTPKDGGSLQEAVRDGHVGWRGDTSEERRCLV